MKNLHRLTFLAAALAAVTLFALPAAADDTAADKLVGSWACLEAGGFLATFEADGTYIAANPTNDTSTSNGVWRKTGPGAYELADRALVYDDDGNTEFVREAQVDLTVDGDLLTASVRLIFRDLDGVEVLDVTVPAICDRIKFRTDD